MPQLPGMMGDVYFGDPDKPLPDWRAEPRPDEDEEDTPLTPAQRKSLAAMLGFDPSELDDDDDESQQWLSTDAEGHEHKGKGEGGGQFTKGGGGGGATKGKSTKDKGDGAKSSRAREALRRERNEFHDTDTDTLFRTYYKLAKDRAQMTDDPIMAKDKSRIVNSLKKIKAELDKRDSESLSGPYSHEDQIMIGEYKVYVHKITKMTDEELQGEAQQNGIDPDNLRAILLAELREKKQEELLADQKKSADAESDSTAEAPPPTDHARAAAEYKELGTKAPAFKAWFGDWESDPAGASKVVNKETGEPMETLPVSGTIQNAKPIILYHGTAAKFESFEKGKSENIGFWFTENKGLAQTYGRKLKTVYLNIKNPCTYDQFVDVLNDVVKRRKETDSEIEWKKIYRDVEETLKDEGYDGIFDHGGPGRNVWIAFAPEQIKAVDNRGTFDPADANIRMSLDATGHEHKGAGTGGGQFVKGHGGGAHTNHDHDDDHNSKASKVLGWAKSLPAAAYGKIKAGVSSKYANLEDRYGPRWSKAIIGAALAGIPVPMPGAMFATAAPVVALAELWRMAKGASAHLSLDEHMTHEEVEAAAKELVAELTAEFRDHIA